MSKARVSILAGDIVVNQDHLFVAILAEQRTIYTLLVHLVHDKEICNSLFFLSETCQRAQEITVSKLTLKNVIWFDPVFKDGSVITCELRNVFQSFPFNISSRFWMRCVLTSKGRLFCWKFTISPRAVARLSHSVESLQKFNLLCI